MNVLGNQLSIPFALSLSKGMHFNALTSFDRRIGKCDALERHFDKLSANGFSFVSRNSGKLSLRPPPHAQLRLAQCPLIRTQRDRHP